MYLNAWNSLLSASRQAIADETASTLHTIKFVDAGTSFVEKKSIYKPSLVVYYKVRRFLLSYTNHNFYEV
jgi:hypothetical protein